MAGARDADGTGTGYVHATAGERGLFGKKALHDYGIGHLKRKEEEKGEKKEDREKRREKEKVYIYVYVCMHIYVYE